MRVLVLGGTVFLGPAVVDAALDRGDDVTIFHRGRHPAHRAAEVEEVLGDRDGGLGALEGRTWDVCVDTSGYVPRIVRASAELLAGAVERYVFVSSVNAYPETPPGLDESHPVHDPPSPEIEGPVLEHYGPLKVGCERAVEAALSERALLLRAGLLVGPRDATNRFAYWVTRMADGGEVLAPEDPGRPVQVLDVRDLAAWALAAAADGRAGAVNAVGRRGHTLGSLLGTCREVSGSDASLTWADAGWLQEQGVAPWQDLPLWVPAGAGLDGMGDTDDRRARAWGLATRPLAETVRDVLAFERARPRPAGGLDTGTEMPPAGITRDRERALLDAWHSASGRAVR